MQPITLNSIFYVPKLSQNLLSVHRICPDNNCWLIFDAFSFWIQDRAIGKILYKGLCNNRLYPIISSTSHAVISKGQLAAFLGKQVTNSIWHKRLGHPSNPIVSQVPTSSNVSCVADRTPSLCQTCLKGKFSKLPFSPPLVKSVKPFDIVHIDVWGPAP